MRVGVKFVSFDSVMRLEGFHSTASIAFDDQETWKDEEGRRDDGKKREEGKG